MNIILGKTSGFCAGVKYTITKAEEELNKSNGETIDCLGEIIHNKQVVDSLENKGLRTINSIDDANAKVIIRAHGISKKVYEIAKERNIELIDLTCPKVLKIHKQAQEYSNKNYFIFLIGIKDHPETIGTYSFCGNNSYIIESTNDVENAISAFKASNLKDLLVICQTTYSVKLFDEIVDNITHLLGNSCNIHIEKSICNATSLRQAETKEISSKVDLMIIIGGKNSSNTKKLYDVASNNCKNVLHIQTKDELDLNFVKSFENIGIMAGASTPSYIVEDVYNSIIS